MAHLSPTQRSYIKKRTKVHELDPSEMAGELNIVPFLDIVVNIIMFLLATTMVVMTISQLDAQLPEIRRNTVGGRSNQEPGLNLNVTITENGIIVAGSGGKLQPGCENTGTGRVITVPPLANGAHDFAALTACVAKVKLAFEEETQVIVGADPTIQYEQLIKAMDALRGPTNALFPDVLLSAGVR